MLPYTPRTVDAQLELHNARLRAASLEEVPARSEHEVRAASGLNPKNPSEPATPWKRERRVFVVRHAGRDLFPALQFADGYPRQIVIWFASANDRPTRSQPRDRSRNEVSRARRATRIASSRVRWLTVIVRTA